MAKRTTPPAASSQTRMQAGMPLGLIVGVIVLAWFALPRAADAATTPVTGWAWSSVAGWISMSSENCRPSMENPDPCALGGTPIAPYGAVIDEQGAITGYAWSRTVGWICFGATCSGTPPPFSPTTAPASAQIDVLASPNDITGWAKVVAAGDDGWISLSCSNTDTNNDACFQHEDGTSEIAYHTTWDRPSGTFQGHAWHGASIVGGSALGWIRWQTQNEYVDAGVETTWQPVDLCASNKNQCSTQDACVLPGEYCCPAGSPCGQCDGNGAQCALNTDCAQGVICCLPGEQCGRCVNTGLSCGKDLDLDCAADGFDPTDACCPPGTVCTRTADGDAVASVPGVIGFCNDNTRTVCVDAAQCGGGTCTTDPRQGLCDPSAAPVCSEVTPCGSGACTYEVGLCDVNSDSGATITCLTSAQCPSGSTCRNIIGICTDDADKRLCVDDTNCTTGRCEKLYLPWLQALYGPIYSTKGVGSPQTAPAPVGKYNATYCILAGGPVVNFLSAEGCGTVKNPYEKLVAPGQSPTISTVARIDVGGIIDGRYGDIVPGVPDGSTPLGGKVYLMDQPAGGFATIESRTFTNGGRLESGAGLIVIRGGDLHLTGNIAYEPAQTATLARLASVGWLVLADRSDPANPIGGNITIDPGVTDLVGAFYAEGTISTGTTGLSSTEQSLRVRGVMIAKEFNFQRSRGSIDAAEQILADGRVLVNTPPGFGDVVQSLPLIRQVVPQNTP